MSATPAAHNKAPRSSPPRPYKHSPLLAKPGKRSRQDALPTAIHMGLCVSVCLLVFAVINIVVTEKLGPRNPFTSLVNSGVMVRVGSGCVACVAAWLFVRMCQAGSVACKHQAKTHKLQSHAPCTTHLALTWCVSLSVYAPRLQMAMLTVTVLATPNLGNSFTKAFQRIVGVMIGEL